MTKILIEVDGGVVNAVFCSEPDNVEIIVRDLDNIHNGDIDPLLEDPSLKALRTGHFAIY